MSRPYSHASGKIDELVDMLDFHSIANLVLDLEEKCEAQDDEINRLCDRIAELEAE